jgi:methylated-DNA-[protein]-cysteine S-methyltransferase
MNNYWIFSTVMGDACVVVGEKGIKSLLLPGWSKSKIVDYLADVFPEARVGGAAPKEVAETIKFVQNYFLGKPGKASPKLDLSGRSEFSKKVLSILMTIGAGETRSYSWVAQQVGNKKAIRAVAQAIAHNPIPLFIPCHRVVGKDGSMTGFSAPGGVRAKRLMLEIESKSIKKSTG